MSLLDDWNPFIQSFSSSPPETSACTLQFESNPPRASSGPADAPPGWIWFNVSSLQRPLLAAAELVLYRKTLHPRALSVNVTLHGATAPPGGAVREVSAVEERLLELHQRSSSGYDVFNVTALLSRRPPLEVVGFRLQFTDESGSLVLHEALTQTFYCVERASASEPLLVFYQILYLVRSSQRVQPTVTEQQRR